MSMRGVWVGAVVVALGVGAWWLSENGAAPSDDENRAPPRSIEAPDVTPQDTPPLRAEAEGVSAQPAPLDLAALDENAASEVAEASETTPPESPERVLGARIAGRVLTLDGAPLPEARVVVRCGPVLRERRWHEQPAVVDEAIADAEGAFAVSKLPTGALRLSAELEGWVCVQRVEGEIARYEEIDGAELIMAPALSVPGSVRDARGAPVEGALLVLDVGRPRTPLIDANALSPKLSYAQQRPVEARSDSSGAFTFEPVAASKSQLKVTHDEHPSLERAERIDGSELLVQLDDGVTLAGIVYGADGEPLADAAVHLRSSVFLGPGAIESRDTTTDEDGAFRLGGLTATDNAYVMLLAPGHAVHVVQPQPLDAEHNTVVEYDLSAERVIAGVLRDAEGAPLEGIHITVQGERVVELNVNMFPIPTWEQRAGLASTTTDASGAFRFGQLYAGEFQLSLTREGQLLRTQTVSAGDDDLELELDLANYGNVHFVGRVSDAVSGLPVARFTMHSWRSNASGGFSGSEHEFEDVGGSYELRGLNPGVLYLSAEAEGYVRAASAKLEYEAGEHVIDLALTPQRELRLRVLRPDGSPVEGAKITFSDINDQALMVPLGARTKAFMLSTDERGELHVFGLPAGPVTVKLTETFGNEEQVESFDLRHPLDSVQTIYLNEEITARPTRRDVNVMLVVLADDRPADLVGTKQEDFVELQTELMPRFVAGEITPLARSIALTFTSAAHDVVEHASYGQNAEGLWERTSVGGNTWSTSEMPGGVSWDVPVGAGTLTLDIEGKGERTIALPDSSEAVQAMLFFAEP